MMAARQPQEGMARLRANEVLEESGISAWPVMPEVIAAGFPMPLPIQVSGGFPPGAFGALYKEGNDFRIVLSNACPTSGFRRFTLAHELGHFFLDGHIDALFELGATVHVSDTSHFRGMRKPWFETEADAFASELLVPTHGCIPLVKRATPGLAAVRVIADTFETSLSCASIRYAALTGDPVAVLLSWRGVVEWACYSAPVAAHSWARRRMKGEWSPPRSATSTLASDHTRIVGAEMLDGTGLLTEWFDGAPVVEVVEEALGLGAYGRVLTVLTCEDLPSPDALQATEERARRGPRSWKEAMRPWGWDDYEDLADE